MDANGPRTGDTGGGFVPSVRTGGSRPRAGSSPPRASGSSTVSAPGAAADGGPDGRPDGGPDGGVEGAWHEGASERIARQVRDAERHAEAAEALRDELARQHASARSGRGEVRVEVDARGRLVRLVLSDRATALPAATLARLVEDTARAAAHQVDASALALVERRLGAGSPLLAAMREDLTLGAAPR